MVKESVKRVFVREPESSVNVDEVVALGAALYAAFKGDRTKLTVVQQSTIENIKITESTSKCFGTISLSHDAARDQKKSRNSILIKKGEKIPCSITASFYTVYDGQDSVKCQVTESTSAETDPRFVKVIWEGGLNLPGGRPSNQEIKVTFAYDANQIMKCSFVDVATGRETKVDLSMASTGDVDAEKINKFMVE
jgi:molecular chaperone DnaK (HSP70)